MENEDPVRMASSRNMRPRFTRQQADLIEQTVLQDGNADWHLIIQVIGLNAEREDIWTFEVDSQPGV
jgi:hypothetical protein